MRAPKLSAAQVAVIVAALVFAVLYVCLACHFLAEIKGKELPPLQERELSLYPPAANYLLFSRQRFVNHPVRWGDHTRILIFEAGRVILIDRARKTSIIYEGGKAVPGGVTFEKEEDQ